MSYLDIFDPYVKAFTLQSATYETLAGGRQVPHWTPVATSEGPLLPASMSLMRYEEGAGVTVTNVLYVESESPATNVAVGNRIVVAGTSYDVVRVRDYVEHKEVELNVVL
jgi:hypothetical protein